MPCSPPGSLGFPLQGSHVSSLSLGLSKLSVITPGLALTHPTYSLSLMRVLSFLCPLSQSEPTQLTSPNPRLLSTVGYTIQHEPLASTLIVTAIKEVTQQIRCGRSPLTS